MSDSNYFNVIIAGGGPAGASAAIHLATRGARVLLLEQNRVKGVKAKHAAKVTNYYAPVTIDATGRTRALARRVAKSQHQTTSHRAPLVAFKAHLEGARVAPGACEIYFYRGGYGGL